MQTKEFEHLFDPSVLGDFTKPIKLAKITKLQEKQLEESTPEERTDLMTKWEEDIDPQLRSKIIDFMNTLPKGMKNRQKRRIVKKKFGIKVI